MLGFLAALASGFLGFAAWLVSGNPAVGVFVIVGVGAGLLAVLEGVEEILKRLFQDEKEKSEEEVVQ